MRSSASLVCSIPLTEPSIIATQLSDAPDFLHVVLSYRTNRGLSRLTCRSLHITPSHHSKKYSKFFQRISDWFNPCLTAQNFFRPPKKGLFKHHKDACRQHRTLFVSISGHVCLLSQLSNCLFHLRNVLLCEHNA